MRLLLRVIKALWLLPVAIPIWVLYLWPAHALGLLRRDPDWSGVAVFEVVPGRSRIWDHLWRPWAGHGLPGAMVLYPCSGGWAFWHEQRHVMQWEALGILFPVVYVLFLARFGYEDSPLEEDARACADRVVP